MAAHDALPVPSVTSAPSVPIAPAAPTDSHAPAPERAPLLRLPAAADGTTPGPQHPMEEVPEECAVALSVNGVSQVVMMATPQALEDFAYGFAFSEGWITARHQVLDLELQGHERGIVVDMQLNGECSQRLQARRRSLAGRSGCGLCGIDSLEQLLPAPRPRPARANGALPSPQALQRAAQELAQRQPWHQRCGGLHAAALCTLDGHAVWVHEDIGRHNALDKVLGAALRSGLLLDADPHFALVSSRASFELVQKAAQAGLPALASVSAPTAQAIRSAQAAGLALWAFVRPGRATRYA